MLNCKKTDNTSMVNKASIIVARDKNIHSVVTFNTPYTHNQHNNRQV